MQWLAGKGSRHPRMPFKQKRLGRGSSLAAVGEDEVRRKNYAVWLAGLGELWVWHISGVRLTGRKGSTTSKKADEDTDAGRNGTL